MNSIQRFLTRLVASIVCDTSPERLARGLLLGILVAWTPFLTLQWFVLIFLVAILRHSLPVTFLTIFALWPFSFILDPIFHRIGDFILTIGFLHPVFARLYHAPIFPFTRFNNTVVTGAAVLVSAIGVAAYVFALRLLRRYEVEVKDFFATDRMFRALRSSSIVEAFPKEAGHRGFRRWFRVEFFPVYAVLFVIALGLGRVCAPRQLKQWIEARGANLNGAQVNVADLKINFLHTAVEFHGIEIANKESPERNVIAIDKLRFHFDPGALLRKKIIITEMKVEGIHHQNLREHIGTGPDAQIFAAGIPTLLERVASGFISGLDKKHQDQALNRLDNFADGLDLNRTLENVLGELPTLQRIEEAKQILDRTAQRWKKLAHLELMEDYSTNRAPANSQVRPTYEKNRQTLLAESKALDEFLVGLSANTQLDKDLAIIKGKLDLPSLLSQDLSGTLFSGKTETYLERVAYWIDWTRRRMPKGTSRLVAQPRARGISYHFGKEAAYPMFFLMHANVTSDIAQDPHGGRVSAKLEGLTTDPSLWGHPLEINLQADFPGLGIDNVRAKVVVDHTGQQAIEHIDLEFDNLPIRDWNYTDKGTVVLGISRGTVSGGFSAHFTEQSVQARWMFDFRNIDHHVEARYGKLEQALNQVLEGAHEFSVTGSIEGPYDKLQFDTKSTLGPLIAQKIKSEFSHEIAAAEDRLRQLLLDRIQPTVERLAQRHHELISTCISELDSRHKRQLLPVTQEPSPKSAAGYGNGVIVAPPPAPSSFKLVEE